MNNNTKINSKKDEIEKRNNRFLSVGFDERELGLLEEFGLPQARKFWYTYQSLKSIDTKVVYIALENMMNLHLHIWRSFGGGSGSGEFYRSGNYVPLKAAFDGLAKNVTRDDILSEINELIAKTMWDDRRFVLFSSLLASVDGSIVPSINSGKLKDGQCYEGLDEEVSALFDILVTLSQIYRAFVAIEENPYLLKRGEVPSNGK